MLKRYGLFAAPLIALALALPAAADLRPKARPFAVDAQAAAVALRPLRNPAYAHAPLSLRVPLPTIPLDLIAGLVAQAAAVPDYAALPVDPPLLAAARRAAPRYEVVTSTANAPLAPPALGPTLRPRARPGDAPAVAEPGILTRPAARPRLPAEPAPLAEAVVVPAVAVIAGPALRPEPRPRGLAQRQPEAQVVLAAAVAPVNPGKPLVRSKKGSVCGDPSIRGETIPPIPAKMRGCGLAEPVRVTEVDGIRLSTPATIDCTTAKALKSWINTGLRPAFGRKNPPVALQVAASYACRPRNNIPGNPVSEHGRGKAIDISAVVLKSGAAIDVLRDWRGSKALRTAHRAGCGPFGTTLGPGSDGYHENHMHFDTSNMNRPYCR